MPVTSAQVVTPPPRLRASARAMREAKTPARIPFRATGLFSGAGNRSALAGLRADPRQAIQQDSICCLVCGAVFRQLTNTHLRGHRMTAREYKRRFGYNRGRPLMCRALRHLYADRAVKNGLASRIRQRPILVQPELRRRGGARQIALEELLTRREVRRRLL